MSGGTHGSHRGHHPHAAHLPDEPLESLIQHREAEVLMAVAADTRMTEELALAFLTRRDLPELALDRLSKVRQDRNVTHHAEVMALSEALRRLDRVSLEDCTIYANAEPCAFCCYAMRESRIGRVVYGMQAPLTGGVTRWNILADTRLSDILPEVFAPPPEIMPGFMREEVEAAIARRTPLVWDFVRARNIFGGPLPHHILGPARAERKHGLREQAMSFLRRWVFDYFGRR